MLHDIASYAADGAMLVISSTIIVGVVIGWFYLVSHWHDIFHKNKEEKH